MSDGDQLGKQLGAKIDEAQGAAPKSDLPRYRCHKIVRAMKIRIIHGVYSQDSYALFPEDLGLAPRNVGLAYMEKHRPVPGGYFVLYEDGYESFSPAQAFEDGYHLMSDEETLPG